ncbi:hypothetical protein QDK90_29200, partial [Streptomyces sp. 12257]|nr:hypothetical protein [Streptomyces sp. 12257]
MEAKAQVRTDCQWHTSRWAHTALRSGMCRQPDDRRFVMASYHAAAARRRRATGPAPSLTGPASDVHPV